MFEFLGGFSFLATECSLYSVGEQIPVHYAHSSLSTHLPSAQVTDEVIGAQRGQVANLSIQRQWQGQGSVTVFLKDSYPRVYATIHTVSEKDFDLLVKPPKTDKSFV